MAKNLRTVINREQAIIQFASEILPIVKSAYEQDGIPDWPARREAWNNWTNGLCHDKLISDWQYENWSQPSCCEDPADRWRVDDIGISERMSANVGLRLRR